MVLHLVGNALIFFGRDIFNEYSHRLMSNPLIVPIEIGLLLRVRSLHIYKAVTMWMQNKAARPVGYQKKELAGHTSRKSLASSTMIASGLILLVFVVDPREAVQVRHVLPGRRERARSGTSTARRSRSSAIRCGSRFYVIATLLVGLHMRHGVSSAFQSLGLDHPRYTRRIVASGIALAVMVGGGLALIPIWRRLCSRWRSR